MATSLKLSIIIPVYNERETLPQILAQVKALPVEKEIIVVDNCSTDGTREWLQRLQDPAVRVILQPRNWGKGTSVRTGLAQARGEYVVVQDADLEYNPQEILRLLAVAEQGHLAVFGSRLLENPPRVPRLHAWGRDFLNEVFRWLYRSRITDVATGYKLLRRELAQSLPLHSAGFELDYELPAKLRKRGIEIVEVPVSYHPRTVAEGKKLRWTVGLTALWALVKYRFTD
ncbi:MAG TPA: glycosyltransferase family 2 protein [Armatimonadetes bacterium]|nr:glycosyltransferase family 2 protein [Armatimonadota bacterium]